MKKFIKKIIYNFLFPILFCVFLVIQWDPFKVFLSYSDYYNNNNNPLNRENVCFNLLNQRGDNISNFIIGSSRSHAYKTEKWCSKINQAKNTVFHYDGSELGLFRATNVIKYLSQRYKIKNILLITDEWFFRETKMPSNHLYIQPPVVSNENIIYFYSTFIKSAISFKFVFSNLVFKLTGKHYPFMDKYLIKDGHNKTKYNNFTGDIWYGADAEIKADSLSYYSNLISAGVFSREEKSDTIKYESIIKLQQVKYLTELQHIIKINKINIKIIISPLFSQRKINTNDMNILINIFGKENIFDFSGKNRITENLSNYYEASHYRPHVDNQIMDSIYCLKSH
jgi:hypothetical protein